MQPSSPASTIKFTRESIHLFPAYQQMVTNGKARFDSTGRLRYAHGAPVGDLILVRVNKDGTPVYKEAASEWFDPGSPRAAEFVWP
jgi:hypothetical protein